jgi:hypothetical protein
MVITDQMPQTSRSQQRGHLHRGAAAVEMALVFGAPNFGQQAMQLAG